MKFCLLTLGHDEKQSGFAFFLTDPSQLAEPERRFTLSPEDIARINPNTKTAPVFRSNADAELTKKIYVHVPVLIDESAGRDGNPWGVSFMAMFDMSNDSGLFRTAAQLREAGFTRNGSDWISPSPFAGSRPSPLAGEGVPAQAGTDEGARAIPSPGAPFGAPPSPARGEGRLPTGGEGTRYVPLFEAKMIHQFDHRWATYDGTDSRDVTAAEKTDPEFEPVPRYWVPEAQVADRLAAKKWKRGWLMGWRDITNATNERTVIATAFPRVGVNHKTPLLFTEQAPQFTATLLANWLTLPLDFVARQKVGGTSLTYFYLKQFPILPPSAYIPADLAFIVPRVLELTYTSRALKPFAEDLGYDGPPFPWDPDRRAHLRAELDAWYARAYGLSRDELRYILDPADVKGADYPSETFRVLKQNEIRRYGEYRTARLVLAAWDKMERGVAPRRPGD